MKKLIKIIACGLVFAVPPASTVAQTADLPAVKLHGVAPAGAAKFNEIPATPELLQQLRKGGFTLYLRHGPTDNTKPDRVPTVDLNDCSTQRPLTEEGRLLMTRVGESIQKAAIPIGDYFVSPLCRARESAAAALPKLKPVADNNLMYVANFTDAEKAPIIANTRKLLSTPPTAGRNTLLLAHAPNLMDLMGYFPKEGTLVIFRPKGESFEYLASIPPPLWPQLVK
jgi:phosphohistidine phosphatase SixA